MPYKSKEKHREYQRKRQRKNREQARKYWRNIRLRVLDKLGGPVCVHCGCDELPLLEINHKDGGGGKEIRRRRKSFFLDIIAGRRKTDDLEIVCMVCNAYHRAKVLNNAIGDWRIEYIPK